MMRAALIIGGLASWWFQDWWLIGVALLTGWLIDADHLVDFAYLFFSCRAKHHFAHTEFCNQ
jgi:hypothetical protein